MCRRPSKHHITATGELERLLAIQTRLHPGLTPAELVVMLVERGHAASESVHGRAERVRALAGEQRYPKDYLPDLRAEWPD